MSLLNRVKRLSDLRGSMSDAICFQCGIKYSGKHISKFRKYCSKLCSKTNAQITYKKLNPIMVGISPSSLGTISELRVCCDLMIKGHHVLRSISPSAPFDIAIVIGTNLLRIEVTTGYKNSKDKIIYPLKDKRKSDIIAVVTKNGDIFYDPLLGSLPLDLKHNSINIEQPPNSVVKER